MKSDIGEYSTVCYTLKSNKDHGHVFPLASGTQSSKQYLSDSGEPEEKNEANILL
jgi:hypothetical protein